MDTVSMDSAALTHGCSCQACAFGQYDMQMQQMLMARQAFFDTSTDNFAQAVLADDMSMTTDGSAATDDSQMAFATAVQGDSAIAFSDITSSSGLELVTQTWGSAVGDFDGDGLVDIWLNRHQLPPILYRNLGDGTYEDVTDEVFTNPEDLRGDFHGSAFIDFDNDGDLDLLQLAGGDQGEPDPNNPNRATRLFVNNDGQFQTEERGVGFLSGRGRVPVLLDPNDDGLLDYVFTGPSQSDGSFPASFFEQQVDGTFQDQGPSNLDVNVPSGAFGVISDLTGDGRPELLYAANNPRLQIYETDVVDGEVTFNDITDTLLPELSSTFIQDVVVGDFNSDGEQDLFIVRQGSFSSGVREDSASSGRARLLVNRPIQRGISIDTTGDLSLNFQGDPNIDLPQFMQGVGVRPEDIRIGADGFSPDSLVFDVDRATATGRPDFTPGVEEGVFIWYENGEWNIVASTSEFLEVNFLYESTEVITGIDSEIDGEETFPINPVRRRSSLLIREGDRFVDRTEGSGLEQAVTASNAVSGDFDNDGDLDLYVVSTDLFSNQPNILYENQGDGTFVAIQGAGGASGAPSLGSIGGVGDGASVSDFDNDGDLDLFVTNGDVAGFRRPFLIDGSSMLFQNDQATGNNSVLFDLVGTDSNRDAVGAQVRVTIDGQTQIREQNGGIHNRSQSDTRLHFGLGESTLIDEVEIRFPSGVVEVFTDVGVNQIFQVVEGSGTLVSLGETSPIILPDDPAPPTPDPDPDPEPPTPDPDPEPDDPDNGNNPPPSNNNLILGTTGADDLTGTANRDIIRGQGGRDTLSGLGGNDNLLGGGGADEISGGAGNDLIVGAAGADLLTGGDGQDRFLLNSVQGVDTLTDFTTNEDVLRLVSARLGGGLTSGSLSDDQFHLGSSATQASHRVIFDAGTGDLFFDVDGSGATEAVQLANLSNTPNLSIDDIEIV